jgi:hypothetical protein
VVVVLLVLLLLLLLVAAYDIGLDHLIDPVVGVMRLLRSSTGAQIQIVQLLGLASQLGVHGDCNALQTHHQLRQLLQIAILLIELRTQRCRRWIVGAWSIRQARNIG